MGTGGRQGVDVVIKEWMLSYIQILQNPLEIFCLISKHCFDDHILSGTMPPLLLCQIFCVLLGSFCYADYCHQSTVTPSTHCCIIFIEISV